MHETASADETALKSINDASRGAQAAVRGFAFPEDSGSALIMKFDTLTPVAGPYANTANAVRGIAGGGLPWVIRVGSGSLSRDGHLLVRLRGLVLASHPAVPVSLRGTNPFPAFRAVVSCLSVDADGTAAIANVSTGDFEASVFGDAEIDARVSLPLTCLAPIVLVTGPAGAERWFAVTGR
ncbi:MAG TPA: hypothetical protein VFQ44_22100 [Streptosporangiaceae bacterium]|nr:hypothetical protein [Streptosporangiaceae bacterium]